MAESDNALQTDRQGIKKFFTLYDETGINYEHKVICIGGFKLKIKKKKSLEQEILLLKSKINGIQNLNTYLIDAEQIPKTKGIMREYQLANAKFLKYCANIFEKHNLSYWLFAGTLLGAVRYKDFIPWDDDIDTGMLREDYDKLADILNEEFKDNPNLYFTKGDIIKILYKGLPMQVDVFAFDTYPQYISDKERIRALKRSMAMAHNELVFDYSKVYTGNCILNKTDEELAQMRKKLYDVPETEKKMLVEGFEYSPAHDGYMVLDYDWVFPLQKGEFAGYTFPIPNKSDLFLFEHYGDYTRIPKNLHTHFSVSTFDIEKIREFNNEFGNQ